MKILIIGDEVSDRNRVSCYTDVMAFYVCQELRKRGIDLVFVNGGTEEEPTPLKQVANWPLEGVDHVLALGLRYFTRTQAAQVLSRKIRGAVTQTHDGALFVRKVDCTFTTRDDAYRFVGSRRNHDQFNHHVGWAADHERIYPAQVPNELCILIDHENYGDDPADHSSEIVESAAQFARSDAWCSKYEAIAVRQLTNGGAVDVDISNPVSRPFSRQHIPFDEICREYGRASIYLVTHRESVGLTCLETAMAGAFIAVPAGDFVPRDRLNTIRHVEFDGEVPWQLLVDSIDVEKSREMAMQNSWEKLTGRIVDYFENFRKRR